MLKSIKFEISRGLVLVLFAMAIGGCATVDEQPDDEFRVEASSDEFRAAARSLQPACNNPAEFGRCGCYLDGIQTSCDLVSRCLEVGFCKVATKISLDTETTSESPLFSEAARSLAPICSNPAEFGRCGCTMDGIKTSCDIVSRCLEIGFCRAVAQ